MADKTYQVKTIVFKSLILATFVPFGLQMQCQPAQPETGKTPIIKVAHVPHTGQGGPDRTELISGTISAAKPGMTSVVIYAFAGGTWWVQPTADSPLTDIADDGSWQTITHLGSTYAVLVVDSAYKPPATTTKVPKVGGGVLAVKLVPGA